MHVILDNHKKVWHKWGKDRFARNMIRKNMGIDVIEEVTGLSKVDIKKLMNQNENNHFAVKWLFF